MPRIVFVCTANICRSPMAAALFQHRLAASSELRGANWLVDSAGTWAADGLPASSGSVASMAQRGIHLEGHRSHGLKETDLRQADLVLVMTAGQREGILADFPFAAGRVHLLSEMGGRTYDIADPYGGRQADYDSCADEIEALIRDNFDHIVKLASSASPREPG